MAQKMNEGRVDCLEKEVGEIREEMQRLPRMEKTVMDLAQNVMRVSAVAGRDAEGSGGVVIRAEHDDCCSTRRSGRMDPWSWGTQWGEGGNGVG